MNRRISEAFRRTFTSVTDATIGRIIRHQRRNQTTNQSVDDSDSQNQDEHAISDIAMPTFSQSVPTQYKRAALIDSSSNVFGSECLRLVNICFHTSQTFPSIMDTCATISQYLRKELIQQFPGEHIHIVISENNTFGFAISDGNHFAEIDQEQYRVLIFTTDRSKKMEYSAHDANSQMVLTWGPILVKTSTK